VPGKGVGIKKRRRLTMEEGVDDGWKMQEELGHRGTSKEWMMEDMSSSIL
jgi:hypothetical protein